MKKFLSVLLAVVMLLSMLPVATATDLSYNYVYLVKNDDVTVTINGSVLDGGKSTSVDVGTDVYLAIAVKDSLKGIREVESVTYKVSGDPEFKTLEGSNGTYHFEMPKAAVRIEVETGPATATATIRVHVEGKWSDSHSEITVTGEVQEDGTLKVTNKDIIEKLGGTIDGYKIWDCNDDRNKLTQIENDYILITERNGSYYGYIDYEPSDHDHVVYTLNFNGNGDGDVVTNVPEPENQINEDDFDIHKDHVPAREGYTFVGWTDKVTDTIYKAGDVYTITSNNHTATLYAVWEEKTWQPTLVFNANGGKIVIDGNENGAGETREVKGAKASVTTLKQLGFELDHTADQEKLTVAREGYEFKGWAASADSTEEINHVTATQDQPTVTVYAIWEAEPVEPVKYTYTLTYEPNGGEFFWTAAGIQETSEEAEKVSRNSTDKEYTFNVANEQRNAVRREGYDFMGWGLTDNASEKVTEVKLTAESPNGKVYAIWVCDGNHKDDDGDHKCDKCDEEQYKLIYDGNGGEFEGDLFMEKTITEYAWENSFAVTSTVPEHPSGSSFKGWATSADGSVEYQAGNTYKLPEGAKEGTLYAVWQNVYTLTYNLNAEDAWFDRDTQTYYSSLDYKTEPTDEAKHTFDVVENGKTIFVGVYRPNYEFIGWSRNKNSDPNNFTPVKEVNVTADEPLADVYAIWKAKQPEATSWQPNLTFRANGGTMMWKTEAQGDYNEYHPVWTREDSYDFYPKANFEDLGKMDISVVREGYTFKGWAMSADSTTEVEKVTVTRENPSATVYAIWEAEQVDVTYILKYDANGGQIKTTSSDGTVGYSDWMASSKKNNNQFTIMDYTVVRDGYTFKGWALSNDAASAKYQAGDAFDDEFKLADGEKYKYEATIYAVWEKNKPAEPAKYTVRFHADTKYYFGSMEDQEMVFGVAEKLNENQFSRVSFLFKGWATEPGGKLVYEDEQLVKNLTNVNGGVVDLYAVWSYYGNIVIRTPEPTAEPTAEPTEEPTVEPTEEPTVEPTAEPTAEPTEEPTVEPTEEPTVEPTEEPTAEPTEEPTVEPTEEPTEEPTAEPTAKPTEEPTEEPTVEPTAKPTIRPTQEPAEDDSKYDDEDDEEEVVPKTGDNSLRNSLVVMAAMMMASVTLVVTRRKSRKNH